MQPTSTKAVAKKTIDGHDASGSKKTRKTEATANAMKLPVKVMPAKLHAIGLKIRRFKLASGFGRVWCFDAITNCDLSGCSMQWDRSGVGLCRFGEVAALCGFYCTVAWRCKVSRRYGASLVPTGARWRVHDVIPARLFTSVDQT